MPIRLHSFQQPLGLEHGNGLVARRVPLQPAESSGHPRVVGHVARRIDHHGHGIFALELVGNLEIVRVVCRRHLEHGRAELALDPRTHRDGDVHVGERDPDQPTLETSVPLVLRMKHQRHIAEHRFGTRRGDDDEIGPSSFRRIRERIPDIKEMVVPISELGFLVGQRRVAPRTPVDDAVAAIDQALVEQVDEHLEDRVAVLLVQREPGAGPVA
jgi:hypothetical protein